MANEFLGRGWKFPVGVDMKGVVKTVAYEDDIREAIWIILSTAKGERVMRPGFGCGIHAYVFEAISSSVLGLIEGSVKDALLQLEPRIEVLKVQTLTDEISQGELIISIDYRVRTTNNRFNLVYPFYLKEGA